MFTCYTGISQCAAEITDGRTALTAAQTASCLADPRYATWRMVTQRSLYDGTIVWYRTDSYWNSGSYVLGSSMGPGLQLSTHFASRSDNNGDPVATYTDLGKTYVMALSDGSGVQMYHLTYSTTASYANILGATAGNTLVTSAASYGNSYPNKYEMDYCWDTNLLLAGTYDISNLSPAVTGFSDGYTATLTLSLDMILAGAQGGWRGTCIMYYSSTFVMDGTNGSMCLAITQSAAAGAGPTDMGAAYLFNV